MEQNPSWIECGTSSVSSIESPYAAAEGGTASMRDGTQQKPAVAAGVSSPASSVVEQKPAMRGDTTLSNGREGVQNSSTDWNGFVRCMGTGDRSEVMNRSLQKYVIHLDGNHPLPTRNYMKRCAWCSLCDSRVACNMNFRSCGVPRSGRSGSEHVSKENM